MACSCAESDTDTCLLHILLGQHQSALYLLRLRRERSRAEHEWRVRRAARGRAARQCTPVIRVRSLRREEEEPPLLNCCMCTCGDKQRERQGARNKNLRTVMPLDWGSRFRRSSADGGCTCAH